MTINRFARCTIIPTERKKVIFNSIDQGITEEYSSNCKIENNGHLKLLKGVYNRFVSDFSLSNLSFKINTFVDAPPGSGLGSSSTLVVALVEAFSYWLDIPLGKYDKARLAYEIERIDLGQDGGKQDQYAASFGGINFLEFYENDRVIVNPLRLSKDIIFELNNNLVLYYTGINRKSFNIIKEQNKKVKQNSKKSVEGMHGLKKQAILIKEMILKGELESLGTALDFGWKNKKNLTDSISNKTLDEIYKEAIDSGATGGKISGAGGGGFFLFYCPLDSKYEVKTRLINKYSGRFEDVQIYLHGSRAWSI